MKILAAYDGGGPSEKVLETAIAHAKAFDAEVAVATSMETGDEKNSGRIKEAERRLEYARKKLESAGTTCRTHLLIRGLEPGEDLVGFAVENGVDEILIGIRSRSRVSKIVFGSTAQYIIFHAACPVVTVKEGD
ncbi:Universal stress protein UspA [Candidatus Desulfarcum epimagneticum]|uniref:Universal stress protein UspA n=1 Tax=uncultured Desulfobacteraceae bacterium TaxID=218296 RepID=A0A484HRA5_9BACT|nr:Universal stress protein UspA [uncultured Desulfobacteraceae bacterium]